MHHDDKNKVDRALLLDFFLTFSRFEYALKAAGFAVNIHGAVSPDWQRFANLLKSNFNKCKDHNLLGASNYFFDNPPLKQVLINNALAWETQGKKHNESDVEFLLRMVKSIRNNLFHGGKHNIGIHEDALRSENLLRNSLIILNECLLLSPKVKRLFDEAII